MIPIRRLLAWPSHRIGFGGINARHSGVDSPVYSWLVEIDARRRLRSPCPVRMDVERHVVSVSGDAIALPLNVFSVLDYPDRRVAVGRRGSKLKGWPTDQCREISHFATRCFGVPVR
jgi:hypothetical protein